MPRIRTIKPKFWDDLKIAKLSRDSRLIFIAMWNFCDDNGVIIADHTWLKSKILPYDDITVATFKKWIDELTRFEFIQTIDDNGSFYFFIPNFRKHQVINRPNEADLFIQKGRLAKLLADSVINHGIFSEQSVPDRKGKEGKGNGKEGSKAQKFAPPTLDQVIQFFKEKGYQESQAKKAFEYYDTPNDAGKNWIDSNGRPVKNWKQKMIAVWMRDGNRINSPEKNKKDDIAASINNF